MRFFLLPCLVGLAHHDTTRCTPSLASCPRASLLGRPCWTSTDSLSRFLSDLSPLLDESYSILWRLLPNQVKTASLLASERRRSNPFL